MTHPILYAGLPEKGQLLTRLGRNISDFEGIIDATCDVLQVDKGTVLSKCRKRPFADARCIAIGLILQVNPDVTLGAIGKAFSRDHSTIIYNRDIFRNLYQRDRKFTDKVNQVLKYV